MAQKLGVYFNEKDLSKSASALPVPGGAVAGYSEKGPTDKGYLCRSEDDLRRIFGQPVALMGDGGTLKDLNRGLHVAFRVVRSGIPVFFKRAIPSTAAPVKASAVFQTDGTNPITATAKGHGLYYNGLSVLVSGIERVTRMITAAELGGGSPVAFDINDNVLPGSLAVNAAASVSDKDDDTDLATFGMAVGGTKVITGVSATGHITVTYEDMTSKTTKILVTTAADIVISYDRTTPDHVVRVFIVDDGTTDPINNNYENYLVSLKKAGKDEAGNACFIRDVINDVSEIIDVTVDGSFVETKLPLSYKATAAAAVAGLAGGTEGTYASGDADVVTAYNVFSNRVLYDILYIFDAGYANVVKIAIADICAARVFPTAYLDPDMSIFLDADGNTLKSDLVASNVVTALVGWRMGLGNKEFASLSGSTWGLITDEFNGGRKLWMPPTYEVAAIAAVVDTTLGSWESEMGPRRGVTNFEKLAINLYDYRNELNAKQVNPLIIDERGIQMYYGNKTLKLTASAMQQKHARKTRGRISREFYFIALDYVAEALVSATFNDLRDEMEAVLANEYGPALESYSLVVGPPATTQDDINNQTLRIKVGLIFNQIAEEIIIETTVFRNGTDLSVQVV